MYCNHCGAPVGLNQVVCPRCGNAPITGATLSARRRLAEHVHLLAIFWFVVAGLWLVPAVVLSAIAGVISGPIPQLQGFARVFAPIVVGAISMFFVAGGALSFATGWGLLKLRPWGRTLALVMAFVALIHPPFGTALGVYTLIVLLPDGAGDEYRRMSDDAGGRSAAA